MSDHATTGQYVSAPPAAYLEQAAAQAERRADRHADQDQWAHAIRWEDIHGRILQIMFDLPVDLTGPGDTAPPDRPLEDLLETAARLLDDPPVGQPTAIAPHLGVNLLDLAREVRSLAH